MIVCLYEMCLIFFCQRTAYFVFCANRLRITAIVDDETYLHCI